MKASAILPTAQYSLAIVPPSEAIPLPSIARVKKLEKTLRREREQKQLEIAETVLKVQEQERTRLGQELHDNINQILATARLFMDATRPQTSRDEATKLKSLEYLSLAIEEIRKLSRELAAPCLEEKGLETDIRNMLDDIELASPLRFRFNYDPLLKCLSSTKKTVLFRVVQEQVKNILKHSGATLAVIAVSLRNEKVLLEVADNGKGFNVHDTPGGIGFHNMRERLRMYKGKVRIIARPDHGCRLVVTIPV